MTGRKRRASTSSVETVDSSDTRWRQESSVVRSVPKGMPSDEWPIFELQDAIVLNKDGEVIENALHAGFKGPFVVRGHLIIDDAEQRSHLIMRVRNSIPLEIRKSTSYSIGESDDGRPLVWVSGQGGWYEIDPCAAYKATYDKMCEATTMYYKIVDIYQDSPPKKPKRAKNYTIMDELAQVFHKYAARVGDGSTFADVIERCNEHAAFFIDQLNQSDGPSWQSTAFYKWLKTEHSDMEKQIEEGLDRMRQQTSATSDTDTSSRTNARARSANPNNVEMLDAGAIQPSQKSKHTYLSGTSRPADTNSQDTSTRASTEHYVRSDDDENPDSAFQSMLNALESCYEAMASSKKGMNTSATYSRLYFHYTFPSYKDGRVGSYKQPVEDTLHYYSKALLQTLDSKYQKHEIYQELTRMAATNFRPLAFKPADFPVFVLPRNSKARKGSQIPSTPSTPVPIDAGRDSSVDAPQPMGKRPIRTPAKSSLRPISGAPKKRPRDEFESDSDAPGAKRNHTDDHVDDTMDDTVDAMDSSQDNDDDDETANKSKYGLEPIKLFIRAERIPDSSPRGPHDTWTCDQEDCDYMVRGGDAEECQERIRQHFHDHEEQMTRVKLAISEGARGHIPINHLIDKIKQMREKGPQGQVQPIKRKLIV